MAGDGPARRRRRASIPAVAFLVLAAGFAVGQTLKLVREVRTDQTDFSVFYRTAGELIAGARGEMYSRRDEPTNWFHCVPPVASAPFLPLHALPIGVAAGIWGAVNLGLLGLATWSLLHVYARLDRRRRLYEGTRVWATVLLLSLANGSLQVGQLTILLIACWMLYLVATVHGRHVLAALALALPAAIKFYPGVVWAVPVGLRARRQLVLLPLAFALLSVAIPLLVYGPRAWDLSRGYVEATFAANSPRMQECFNVNEISTESLDVLLLRWLTHDPVWHERHSWFPHLRLARQPVLRLAMGLRVLILVVAGVAAWRYRPVAARHPIHSAIMLMALWASTMYLLLPDPKSRYALYMFPAFMPLLAWTAGAWALRAKGRAIALTLFIILCAACIAQATPKVMWFFESSVVATFAVWLAIVREVLRERRRLDGCGSSGRSIGRPADGRRGAESATRSGSELLCGD